MCTNESYNDMLERVDEERAKQERLPAINLMLKGVLNNIKK